MKSPRPRHCHCFAALALGTLLLTACSSPEESARKHLQAGNAYLLKGDLDDALEEFKSANDDTEHAEAYFGMALIDEQRGNYTTMRNNLRNSLEVDDGMIAAKLRLAQLEIRFDNLEEAMRQVDGVLIAHGENTDAQLLKAEIYLRNNKLKETLAMLDMVQAAHPEDPQALALKARYHLLSNQPDQARQILANALLSNPASIQLRQLQVGLDARNHDNTTMIADLQALINLDPGNEHYKLQLVPLYIADNRLTPAETLLREMINRNPNRVENKLLLLQFLNNHAPDKLNGEFEHWLADTNLPVEQLLEIARWLLLNHHPRQAGAGFNHIVKHGELQEHRLEAQVSLAEISFDDKDYATAAAIVRSVLQQDSDFIRASFLQARIHLDQQQPDDAIQLLNNLRWSGDNSGNQPALLGQAYAEKNDLIQAEKNYRAALDQNPANPFALFPVYLKLLHGNQRNAARQLLDKALQAKPQDDALLTAKVELEIEDKNWAEATDLLQTLAAHTSRPQVAYLLQGNISQGMGDYREAIESYKKALAKDPENIKLLTSLVQCYAELHDSAQATAYLEDLSRKQPGNAAIAGLLARLHVNANMPATAQAAASSTAETQNRLAEAQPETTGETANIPASHAGQPAAPMPVTETPPRALAEPAGNTARQTENAHRHSGKKAEKPDQHHDAKHGHGRTLSAKLPTGNHHHGVHKAMTKKTGLRHTNH